MDPNTNLSFPAITAEQYLAAARAAAKEGKPLGVSTLSQAEFLTALAADPGLILGSNMAVIVLDEDGGVVLAGEGIEQGQEMPDGVWIAAACPGAKVASVTANGTLKRSFVRVMLDALKTHEGNGWRFAHARTGELIQYTDESAPRRLFGNAEVYDYDLLGLDFSAGITPVATVAGNRLVKYVPAAGPPDLFADDLYADEDDDSADSDEPGAADSDEPGAADSDGPDGE